jgi:DNA polymerase-3 subunit delta
MPAATPSTVRAQIAMRTPAPVYVIVGDDDVETSRLAADFASLVDDDLRAFNVERVYATDKGVTAGSIADSARLLPMMSDRRVVVVLRAEKLLKPKRRGKMDEDAAEDGDETPTDVDALDDYVKNPETQTVLVFVAADIDRGRKLSKTLLKNATIVECWGLLPGRDARVDLFQVARQAEALVKKTVGAAGHEIEPAAAQLLAKRAGTDITTLRGDVERLLLYVAGRPKITMADVREVVSAETSQDDWAVTNAIQRGDRAEALRQLALSLEAGGVPYQILGQLAWFARDKLPYIDPRRVPTAIDALFRTDLDLKSSGGDPRVLLERLVVELCGGPRQAAADRLATRPASRDL